MFVSAAEENDFIFALYGAWGRGKSTLIKRVARLLGDDGVLGGWTRNYAPIFFSAWKYPTRPEVWIHLYQTVTKAAQQGPLWQKLRIGFRIGLLKNGWAPLLLGFSLLTISRLQIDFAQWVSDGLGAIGLLIVISFAWSATKLGKKFSQSYFSMPNHAEKLGLQAVIGDDLKTLLKVWINARVVTGDQEKTRSMASDFSRWWPARLALTAVVGLIWLTLMLVTWKIHEHLTRSTSTTSISTQSNPPGGMLSQRTAVISLYYVFGGIAIIVPIVAITIATRPRQHERALLVVDDLDRCEPDQMLAVIESLRLFLDDAEMSQRLQVAMLIDRRILYRAITTRAENSKIFQKDDSKERFFRHQEEKLFVSSLELPPLQTAQAKQLALLTVNREYREQLEVKIRSAEQDIEQLDFSVSEPVASPEGMMRSVGEPALRNLVEAESEKGIKRPILSAGRRR